MVRYVSYGYHYICSAWRFFNYHSSTIAHIAGNVDIGTIDGVCVFARNYEGVWEVVGEVGKTYATFLFKIK
jgi:hypothetical protein